MRMGISIPMTHYYKLDIIIPMGNKVNIDQVDYPILDKMLRASVVNIQDKTVDRALWQVINKVKDSLSIPTTYRLWFNKSMYVEETITE